VRGSKKIEMGNMSNNSISNNLLPPNVKKILIGRHTIIKPISPSEINDKYLSWLNDKDINQYLEVRYKKQEYTDIINYINYLRSKESCELFAIFLKKEKLHIGNATITSYNLHDDGCVDFGIMLGDSRTHSMGIGGEIHVLLLEYFFSDPRIIRINAGAYSDNVIACRTLESVGYIKEGVFRKRFLLSNGQRCDANWYGMLREDWEVSKNKLQRLRKNILIENLVDN